MNNGQRTVERELKVAEEAAEWLEKLPSANESERREYVDWLAESALNVQAFLHVSAIDASLDRVDPEGAIEVTPDPEVANWCNVVRFSEPCGDAAPVREDYSTPRRIEDGGYRKVGNIPGHEDGEGDEDVEADSTQRRPSRWWIGIAAGGATLAVIMAGLLSYDHYRTDQWQAYVTADGERKSYALPDGSLLKLNAATRVEVRYSGKARELRLESGEAIFKVRHDTSRPFNVYAGNVGVQAVGTEFAVQRRSADAVVAVLEGRVRVDRNAQALSAESGSALPSPAIGLNAADAPVQPVYLSAGEEARVRNDGLLEGRGKADLTRLEEWREHRLVFVNENLENVIAEFNRFNPDFQIRIGGPGAAAGQYFTMSFDAEDPESLLAVLERNPALRVERRKHDVVIRAQ